MENMGILIAVIATCVSMVGVLLGAIFWTRGESNSVRSELKSESSSLRAEANADRRDMVNLMFAIKEDIHAIHLEMKDFHNRLCEIEKKRGNP